jgi:hypothetical protein
MMGPVTSLRPALVVLALLGAVGLPLAGYLRPAAAEPPPEQRSYTVAEPACTMRDSRLNAVSGMAVRSDGTWVINDRGAVLYRLRADCSVAEARDLAPELKKLGTTLVDVEDLALGPDGWLWLSDSGGNRTPRGSVTLVGWKDVTTPVRVVTLKYSTGTHDTEALMLDMTGRAVVVTKVGGSAPAQVFASRLPVGAGAQNLRLVGTLTLPRPDGAGSGARLVTAGDVDRTGTYAVLRTYTNAWEFDAPDGDVADALVTGTPRLVPLPETAQGEAIAYTLDGSELLTSGEGSPVDLDRVQIVNGR